MKLLGACGYMSSYSDSCMYTVSSELKVHLHIQHTKDMLITCN